MLGFGDSPAAVEFDVLIKSLQRCEVDGGSLLAAGLPRKSVALETFQEILGLFRSHEVHERVSKIDVELRCHWEMHEVAAIARGLDLFDEPRGGVPRRDVPQNHGARTLR